MNKTVIYCLIFILSVFQFTGCVPREELEELNEMYEKSIEYYTNKYNLDDISIKDYYIARSPSNNPIPVVSGPKCYIMSDGTEVMWVSNEKKFVDNRQSAEIKKDVKSEILYPIIKKYEKEFNVKIRLDDNIILEHDLDYIDKEECYFNEKYDGNIKSFLKNKNKKFTLKKKDIIFVCDESQSYKEDIFSLATELKEYFSSEFSVFAVNDKRAKSYEKKDEITPIYERIYDNGCYGVYSFSTDIDGTWHDDWYEKKFIEVIQGISASYSGSNYQLKYGDIIFSESLTGESVQDTLDEYYERTEKSSDNKNKAEHKIINPCSPIYKIEFSNKLKQNLGAEDYITFELDSEKFGGMKLCEYYYYKADDDFFCDVSSRERNIFGLIHISAKDLEEKYYYIGNYKLEKS